MTNYLQALTALEYLLDKAGKTYWRDWLRQDISLWKLQKDVSHHLAAYGGMGSINDVWITPESGYITKQQAPWVNNLFELLKGLCFQLARTPDDDQVLSDPNGNRYFPILSAFQTIPDYATDSAIRQLSSELSQLHGWRCLECGYSVTYSHDIEDYLAKVFLPKLLDYPRNEQEWKTLVDDAFAANFDGLAAARSQIMHTVLNSDIEITDREGWLRPCPKCGSNDTAVYRWQLIESLFQASKDNLPLRRRSD